MSTYRVGLSVEDLLIVDVEANDEEEAKKLALIPLAAMCAVDVEPLTVRVAAVVNMDEAAS